MWQDINIVRKSIDARRSGRFAGKPPRVAYVVDVKSTRKKGKREGDLKGESSVELPPTGPASSTQRKEHVAVVGSGPAGLFACLELAGIVYSTYEMHSPDSC